MYKYLNPEGKIPAFTNCPFKDNCEMVNAGICLHNGTSHEVPFSCATARGFDKFTQKDSYQVGFLRKEPARNYYLAAILKINNKKIAELFFHDMTDEQVTQYIKELITEEIHSDYVQEIIDIISNTFDLYLVDDQEISVEYIKGVNP